MALPVPPPVDMNAQAMHLLSLIANPRLLRLQYAERFEELKALETAKRIDYKSPSNVKQRDRRLVNLYKLLNNEAVKIVQGHESYFDLLVQIMVLEVIVTADVDDKAAKKRDERKALQARLVRQTAESAEVEAKDAVKTNKKRRRARDPFAEREVEVDAKHVVDEAEEATEEQIAVEERASTLAAAEDEAQADGHSVFSEGRLAAGFASGLMMQTS